MAEWGCRPLSWGRWALPRGGEVDVHLQDDRLFGAQLHALRMQWRCFLVERWLQKDRIDSALARDL
eukprot:12736585-Alexandrium_andersonii.AAC.1